MESISKPLTAKNRGLARPSLICGEGRGDHLKDELSVLQLVGKNVTSRLRFHVKTTKKGEHSPSHGREMGLIVFTSQVLRQQYDGKIHYGNIMISSDVNDELASGFFPSER